MSMTFLTRRRLLAAGGAGLAALPLGMRPMRAAAQTPVSLQLSWLHSVQFAGSYIAQDRGFWRDAGLEVALQQEDQRAGGTASRVWQCSRRDLGSGLHRRRRGRGRRSGSSAWRCRRTPS